MLEHAGILPPASGAVLRVIDVPPEPADPEANRRAIEAVFRSVLADADHAAGGTRHPGMHATATVDHAIVLAGEMLDEDEAVMRAGDILIQRGTCHAWANRSSATARMAFVLVDARR